MRKTHLYSDLINNFEDSVNKISKYLDLEILIKVNLQS